MQAGALDQRITLQALVPSVDSIGQPVQTWATAATVWASVRVLSGLTSIKSGADTATTKASFRLRTRSGITTANRILWRGEAWQIDAVLIPPRADYMDIIAVRVV